MSRASGIGSWPGEDVRAALVVVRDTLAEADLPYLPELPDRGPGADMVGRSAALLTEMPVDLQPGGWRFVDRPGRDLRRATSWLGQDLDELAEAFDGYEGELKVQVAGPWTLAASIMLPRLERAVSDPGACRDLIASLAQGLRGHLESVARLVPGARLIVQVDEPGLPAVLAGRLPTASGFGRLRAVEPAKVADGLRAVVAAAGDALTVIHCCAKDIPIPLLRATGTGAISLDTTLLDARGWESVAATVEAGVALWAGVLPVHAGAPTDASLYVEGRRPVGAGRSTDGDPPTDRGRPDGGDRPTDRGCPDGAGRPTDRGRPDGAARPDVAGRLEVSAVIGPLMGSWHGVGLPMAALDAVTLTPTCGLAGSTPLEARAVHEVARQAARALTESAGS